MSARDFAGLGLLAGAAVFGVRAYQQYRGQGGAIVLTQAPEPVAPNAYEPVSGDWLSSLAKGLSGFFDWPSYVPGIPDAGQEPVTGSEPVSSVSNDELTLARTIYGEAGQETTTGKQAVACVIMNRVRSPRWPNSVSAVCRQPWQFSCWNSNDPMRARIENRLPGSSSAFDECVRVAKQAARGQLSDITGGATHYYANYIKEPAWVRNSPGAQLALKVGVHLFYRGIS